jgi:hypothetical protein
MGGRKTRLAVRPRVAEGQTFGFFASSAKTKRKNQA